MPLTLILLPYTQVEWNTVLGVHIYTYFLTSKMQQNMAQSFRKYFVSPISSLSVY